MYPCFPLASLILPPMPMFLIGVALLFLFGWYFSTDNERSKRILGTSLTILTVTLAVASFMPPKDRIKKGIDLKGGTSFLIRLVPGKDAAGNTRKLSREDLDKAVETYRKRVDEGGVGEPLLIAQPPERIRIELPGAEPEMAKKWEETLKKVAKLEFRMVIRGSAAKIAAIDAGTDILDPAYERLKQKREGNDEKAVESEVIVAKKVEIAGKEVADSSPHLDPVKGWGLSLSFKSEGAKRFEEITKHMEAGRDYFAIVLDNVVISQASIKEEIQGKGISGGSAYIDGHFTEQEVRSLASNLKNPLENEAVIESVSTTSASLGDDAVHSGILAGIVGAVSTVLVTLLYYRFAGLVATFALFIFCLLLFGAMGFFGVVMTLPGIAGVLLTLGMAIDANVLIYERLREEQAAGKTLKTALDAAYDKAFSAIFDSNLTTLITAGILYWKASGPVQGFAVTLIIGVLGSMFTALIVTRNLFSWGMTFGLIKKITMANLIPVTKFDFMSKRKISTVFSLVVIGGSVAIFALRGEKNFGVDFKGGERLVMQAEGTQPPLNLVRDALKETGQGEAAVQMENSGKSDFMVIRDKENTTEAISKRLIEKFPEAKFKNAGIEKVGGVVGMELATNSLIALLLGMVGILIYVTARFELSFAVGALVALLHDVIITVGVFSLLGRELSLVIVGAVLTIAGYSVNDTIVVFDRIRETIHSGRAGTISQIMNLSINETLSRTILTGGVTLLTTLALFFVGGPVLNDFALTILIGILVGTYSSIFIAAPIVLWWSGRGGRDLKTEIKKSELEVIPPAKG